MFGIFKKLFGAPTDFKQLVQNGAIIIDVRSATEYKAGHIPGSLNIPVDSIKNKVEEIRKRNKPVITCCRSGARSGMAKSVLTNAGIECYNGGPWNMLVSKIR
jgi:phage shock protein E